MVCVGGRHGGLKTTEGGPCSQVVDGIATINIQCHSNFLTQCWACEMGQLPVVWKCSHNIFIQKCP